MRVEHLIILYYLRIYAHFIIGLSYISSSRFQKSDIFEESTSVCLQTWYGSAPENVFASFQYLMGIWLYNCHFFSLLTKDENTNRKWLQKILLKCDYGIVIRANIKVLWESSHSNIMPLNCGQRWCLSGWLISSWSP